MAASSASASSVQNLISDFTRTSKRQHAVLAAICEARGASLGDDVRCGARPPVSFVICSEKWYNTLISSTVSTMGKRVTVPLLFETVEAVRDAVFYSPGETISNFVAQACAAELRRRAQRNGAPYPKRTAPLRRGRPINRDRERNAVEE